RIAAASVFPPRHDSFPAGFFKSAKTRLTAVPMVGPSFGAGLWHFGQMIVRAFATPARVFAVITVAARVARPATKVMAIRWIGKFSVDADRARRPFNHAIAARFVIDHAPGRVLGEPVNGAVMAEIFDALGFRIEPACLLGLALYVVIEIRLIAAGFS